MNRGSSEPYNPGSGGCLTLKLTEDRKHGTQVV